MHDDFEYEHQKDRAEIANEQGFTGSFVDFIAWLEAALVYGGIRVHDEAPNDFGRPVVVVETVTGGYSSDEAFLGRLDRSIWLSTNWVRSERGGLRVYEFPEWIRDGKELEWLAPDNGLFKQIYRARTLRVITADGAETDFLFEDGAELLFTEPDRDILEPAGVLTVRPAPPLEPLAPVRAPAPELSATELAEFLGLEIPPRPKPAPPKARLSEPVDRINAREGSRRFTKLAQGQIRDLAQTTGDIAALLDAPHVSVSAPSGPAMNHYCDDLLILVDGACVISVVEVDSLHAGPREPSPSLWEPLQKAPSGGAGRRAPSNGKEFVAMLEEHGFITDRGGSGHQQATHPDHPEVRVTIPGTPSDHRSMINTVALVKRLTGIDITQKTSRAK